MNHFVARVALVLMALVSSVNAEQGKYFAKKAYVPKPLPKFADTKAKLPSPIFDEDPDYVRCYWKAWELGFRNFHEPIEGSGFVSQLADAGFSNAAFQWDTCFITMFCKYGHPHVPGIGSLDNFYARQYEDGEICREIVRATGVPLEFWINKEKRAIYSSWGYDISKQRGEAPVLYVGRETPLPPPELTLDALNHPLFAWAELESFRITGDKERLRLVWQPLVAYHAALKKYLRQGNGLYLTDWASMDNSPRNPCLASGGTGVDMSAEMVLFARNLSEIATILGMPGDAREYQKEAEDLSAIINTLMWDPERQFYFDVKGDNTRCSVKTIAGFWTLLAKVATGEKLAALVAELRNPRTFNTPHRVPTVAADEPGFDKASGDYWRGAIWPPTEKMVVAGLEASGQPELAREIALNHLGNVISIFKKTGTVFENYAPMQIQQGNPARPDFVGWSGMAPIAFFIEYGIGIRADASASRVTWDIRSPGRVGIERFWFGGKTASLMCEPADAAGKRILTVQSSGDFNLLIRLQGRQEEVHVSAGKPFSRTLLVKEPVFDANSSSD
jgi:hypothetical protein